MTQTDQHYLTAEELKANLNSCWLCGCNWQQDHVSLDCQECGGYALTRPCPNCEGKCNQIWKRNINKTHNHHTATWTGQCLTRAQSTGVKEQLELSDASISCRTVDHLASSSCCSSQASSTASSDCDYDQMLSEECWQDLFCGSAHRRDPHQQQQTITSLTSATFAPTTTTDRRVLTSPFKLISGKTQQQ